ncbi:MAG: hydroxysqualene dehydroxylase HpnE [Terracidiphilus sp.]|nr:hydroxysqualene dehydroxylase HpnE [Terracidiphilus sp.]MDR3796584.1 hydroxysqualene dehydroxylase HpnE [Terracidiphilus sp.]
MSDLCTGPGKTAIVVGAGVAGMSAACALAEAGLRVQLVERRGYLGGRASSYRHPGVDEVIDNCQHVLFGCCTNLIGFYRRIGVDKKIHWTRTMTMIEPGGQRSVLGPSWLPAPLHGLPSLLTAKAFTREDKKALIHAFRALMRPVAPEPAQTLGTWLRRNGQTQGAIDRFWRLVIASALNADVDEIALPYAAKVIRELFLNSAQAGAMGMSSVPLTELYAGAEQFLRARGGDVVFNSGVESADYDEESSQWKVTTRAGTLAADYLVLALPFEAMGKLLPLMPPAEGLKELAAQIERQEHGPICSVHLWFERDITDLEHAVLLDRTIHWMYNKSRLQPGRAGEGSYLELVISASHEFAALSREEAIELALRELKEFFPAVAEAKLVKAALVKEVRATFTVPPGIDAFRPTSASPWPNCVLAGDWIATGWPSTMESAARSGHLAAEAVCAALGDGRKILNPDLKPRGLMRFLG